MVEALGLVLTLLIGGVLADRYPRKLLLIGSDGARALVLAALAVVDATGHLRFGVLVALVALHGLASGLFQPALGGILPLLVEEPSLGSANALVGVSRQTAFVVGPAIAGAIYGLAGSSAVFAADGASFLASAAFLWFAQPRVYEPGPVEGLRRELAAGLRYVVTVPWLWLTIATFSVVLMVGYAAFQVLLPKLVEQEWSGGVGSYGLLFTLQGLGMLIGSVAFAQAPPLPRWAILMYALFLLNSLFTALLGLSPWYAAAALLQIGRGFCIGFGITLWDTMVMRRVPQHMLSRVISMDWFGSIGLLPAGLGIWAVLSDLAEPGTLITVSSLACACLFAAGLATRAVRRTE